MAKPSEDEIRIRAHQLWELAGRPAGREHEFWYEAQRELNANDAQRTTSAASNPDEGSEPSSSDPTNI